MNQWLDKMQSIDRRVLYVLLVVVMLIPMVVRIRQPVHVFPRTQALYDFIEKAPQDKIVLLLADWGGATKGENWPQTEAVVEHMMRRGVKFAIMGGDPAGVPLTQQIAERQSRLYGRTYGKDWVNFGYKPLPGQTILSFAANIPDTIERDVNYTPVRQLPLMRQVHDMRDVSLVYEVAAAAGIVTWIGLVQPTYKTPMAFGCTAVCAPEVMPYLDSGQLIGMLVGMAGGAEYEALLGSPRQATLALPMLSLSHVLIILLVILGNIGYLAGRARARKGD